MLNVVSAKPYFSHRHAFWTIDIKGWSSTYVRFATLPARRLSWNSSGARAAAVPSAPSDKAAAARNGMAFVGEMTIDRQWFSAGKPGSESDSRFPQPDAAGGGARTPAHGRAWAGAQHLSSVPLCIDSGPAPWQIAIAARGAAHKPPDGGKRAPRAPGGQRRHVVRATTDVTLVAADGTVYECPRVSRLGSNSCAIQ